MSLRTDLASKLAAKTAETRRRAILEILSKAGDYEVSEDILSSILADPDIDLAASADDLRADLQHLRTAVCVEIREIGNLWSARLTQRGMDVLNGRAHAVGIARPPL